MMIKHRIQFGISYIKIDMRNSLYFSFMFPSWMDEFSSILYESSHLIIALCGTTRISMKNFHTFAFLFGAWQPHSHCTELVVAIEMTLFLIWKELFLCENVKYPKWNISNVDFSTKYEIINGKTYSLHEWTPTEYIQCVIYKIISNASFWILQWKCTLNE